jgi:hypothetical protein
MYGPHCHRNRQGLILTTQIAFLMRTTTVWQESQNISFHRLSSLRNSSVRSVESCLGILLVKLRTELPNSILSTLFSLTKSQIQRSIHSAKNTMMSDYVPHHLGFSHIDHKTFVREHNTPLAKTLFTSNEKSAVLVLDGTYIYIQKSSNYKFQRVSYCLHKHRPLVKMMIIVASDGYILNVIGPYRADGKNNDVCIAKHIHCTRKEWGRN